MSILFWQLFLLCILVFMFYNFYLLGQSGYSSQQKVLYSLLILLLPLFGSLVYFFFLRKEGKKLTYKVK